MKMNKKDIAVALEKALNKFTILPYDYKFRSKIRELVERLKHGD